MYRSDSDAMDAVSAMRADSSFADLPRLSPMSRAAKRFIDVAGVFVFLAAWWWLFIVIAIGVKRSSPGPVLFVQDRVGRGGRMFRFYKFRSMVLDSDEALTSFLDSDEEARSQWGIFQKLERDPRITRFGKFIRKTSLDELPQMWNVLKGDMSLVGPRPCMPEQEQFYGRYWASYCAMKPGLTGLWQVSGRNNLSYSDRVRLDDRYVRKWSLQRDWAILLKTVRVVLSAKGSQ